MGRICDADYTTLMTEIVQNIEAGLNEISVVDQVPVGASLNESTLSVWLNGSPVSRDPETGFEWSGETWGVSFPGFKLKEGDQVEVSLEVQVP